jgi:hypothetical protein
MKKRTIIFLASLFLGIGGVTYIGYTLYRDFKGMDVFEVDFEGE